MVVFEGLGAELWNEIWVVLDGMGIRGGWDHGGVDWRERLLVEVVGCTVYHL